MTVTNTVDYYGMELITAVKSFVLQIPEIYAVKRLDKLDRFLLIIIFSTVSYLRVRVLKYINGTLCIYVL